MAACHCVMITGDRSPARSRRRATPKVDVRPPLQSLAAGAHPPRGACAAREEKQRDRRRPEWERLPELPAQAHTVPGVGPARRPGNTAKA
jgi:hypothetical protein